MIFAGIDAGSRTVKVIAWDAADGRIAASGVVDQGVKQSELAARLLEEALSGIGATRKDVAAVVATGYGRDVVESADTTVTEITCQARGVRHLVGDARTVIDVGGQDSKLIRLDADGKVRDFMMNDRCAAGTGRFLEVVAERLDIPLSELANEAAAAKEPAAISSMCVVFAETEIVGLLAAGEAPSNIVAGVQNAIASRITTMAGRSLDSPVVFTGGVAMVPGMRRAVESALESTVLVPEIPQLTGALGAALLAAERQP